MAVSTVISHRLTINTEPSVAFMALTQSHHFQKWWSADSDAQAYVGGKMKLGGTAQSCAVVVERLEPGLVEWKFVQEDPCNRSQDDCVGTRVRFQIQRSAKGGSELAVSHQGWKSHSPSFKRWSQTWAQFAAKSLKAYLETGVGIPVN
jgi:uncharacterized protein YndB with AHSA1/START domain